MTQEQRLERFVAAGKIIAGGDHGWTARLARKLDMNRGYIASVVSGTRPVNEDLERRLSVAIGAWWDQVRDDAQIVMRIRIELDVELGKGGEDACL